MNSESFILQSAINTTPTTSVTLTPCVPAQSVRRESVISSNPTVSTLNSNVDAFILRLLESAVTTSSQSASLVWSHQYQRPAASSIAPNVPRTTNVNTAVNEQLAPTEATCRSPNLEQGLLTLANSLAQQMSLSRLLPQSSILFMETLSSIPDGRLLFKR